MVIEAWLQWEFRGACEISDQELEACDGALLSASVERRQQLVDARVGELRQKIERLFFTGGQLEFRLVFPSKMNCICEERK